MLTHINQKGECCQVPVQTKPSLYREAQAAGFIKLSSGTLKQIRGDQIAKGNVLATARIAGIQAAKKTADLIPLCHPLLLEQVAIDFRFQKGGIQVNSKVVTTGKTGVEMEALTAVQVALLTIYDMCKAVDKKMSFEDVHLVKKMKGAVT